MPAMWSRATSCRDGFALRLGTVTWAALDPRRGRCRGARSLPRAATGAGSASCCALPPICSGRFVPFGRVWTEPVQLTSEDTGGRLERAFQNKARDHG